MLRMAVLSCVLAAGCASWLPAPVPMRSRASRASVTGQARCLLLWLPGLGDSDADFERHGFVDAVRTRKLSVDVISANATLGYYARRTLLDRFDTDVLGPARAAGYEQVWIGGISMGGLGSLLVARRHVRDLAGIILIAPWLGDGDVIDEIQKAGGLDRWEPPAHIDEGDYQREVWRWLRSTTSPPIYLASADQDPLYVGHRLLAHVLPAGHVFRTRGNHDWGPWARLWAEFLDRSDFRVRCGPP